MGFGSTLGGQEDVVSVGIIGRLSFLCASNTQTLVLAIFLLFPGFYMKLEKVKRNNGRWTS